MNTDLSNLRERYEWAESHPDEARRISEAGTAFVKYMGTIDYWERVYDRIFVTRLRPTIEAYKPMGRVGDEFNDKNVEEREKNENNVSDANSHESRLLKLAEEFGSPLMMVGECHGLGEQSCTWMAVEK